MDTQPRRYNIQNWKNSIFSGEQFLHGLRINFFWDVMLCRWWVSSSWLRKWS